ncbi:hypothetical protein QBC39DRAFT_247105 [Podospora conica]|nr:hypothetical protein QBC39DRAFT_247105 [Schizothecium conicum]
MSTTNTTVPLDPARASESRGYQLTTTLVICPIFALVLVTLRVYTRLVILQKRFWEDFVMVLALLSILLQYVRVSVMPLDRRLCRALIAVLCTGYAIFIVLRMVRCVPFASQWTPGMPGARCYFNATWFMFASQAWNMVMDFVILVVPVLVLRHSRAPWLQRVLIGVVLAFGASACIISALRLQTLYPSTTSKDPSWDKIPSAIYGIIEVNVGIACASVVTLRPLYRRLREAVTGKKKEEAAPASDLDVPGRRVLVGGDEFALMTGETTKIGSDADQRGVELGEGMRRGRESCESSVGDKEMSLAESRTVVSERGGEGRKGGS